MNTRYPPLAFTNMPIGAGYSRPEPAVQAGLSLDSPALDAMTDLRKVTALTVERSNTLAATRERMHKLGVHLLLVTGATGAVLGLVTASDLDSGRPQKIAGKTGERPEDLLVQDIMTLRGWIEVLPLARVREARIGHVVSSLRQAGRRHALVLDETAGETGSICGIFSLTRLCAQIGLDVRPGDPMSTIEAVLAPLLD